MKSSVFSREWKVAKDSESGEEVKCEGEQTDGVLLGVRSKGLVQHRLWSDCRISETTRLEVEIEKDMTMSELIRAVGL